MSYIYLAQEADADGSYKTISAHSTRKGAAGACAAHYEMMAGDIGQENKDVTRVASQIRKELMRGKLERLESESKGSLGTCEGVADTYSIIALLVCE